MGEFSVLHQEPRYKVEDLVQEIIGRRDDTIQTLAPELKKLVLGLVDQFAAMKKHDPFLQLPSVKFERIRWVRDGRVVIDVFHNRRPFTPRDARWD